MASIRSHQMYIYIYIYHNEHIYYSQVQLDYHTGFIKPSGIYTRRVATGRFMEYCLYSRNTKRVSTEI